MSEPILTVSDLGVAFGKGRKAAEVVRGVNFSIPSGKTMALVGESGSGKSVTCRTPSRPFIRSGRRSRKC